MARQSSLASTAFNTLPIELNQAIARELEADADIARYRLICRSTNSAVDADKFSFWRARFRERFAFREGRSNAELKKVYMRRQKLLRRGTGLSFFRGHSRREGDVVVMLRDLIVDSFQGPCHVDEYGRARCKNQDVLLQFVLDSKILLNDRRAPKARNEPESIHPMLATVKLMCSHFLFELKGAKHNVFAVEESQRIVYMATNTAPMYLGPHLTEVNTDWILHCLQFFRHHMMSEQSSTLYAAMSDLSPLQKPSAWQGPLRNGSYPLCSHWKGTYAFLDIPEITKLRQLDQDHVGDEFFCDKNVDEGKIQSLQLDFIKDTPLRWPRIFENRLHSLRNTREPQSRAKPKTDARCENIQFVGAGTDLEDDFNAIGWLNPLPPQNGIPGWQRITFMKHFMDDFDQVEQDNLWAYEGVVLPGGRIILGRWWYASDTADLNNDYNGPFILWALDRPDQVVDESGDGD